MWFVFWQTATGFRFVIAVVRYTRSVFLFEVFREYAAFLCAPGILSTIAEI